MPLTPDAERYRKELFEAARAELLKQRELRRSELRQNLHDIDEAAKRAGYAGVLQQPDIDYAVAVSNAAKDALCKAYEWDGKDLTEGIVMGIEADVLAVLKQSLAAMLGSEKGRLELKARRIGASDPSASMKLDALSRHLQRTICDTQKSIHSELTLRMLDVKKARTRRKNGMTVKELSSRIEAFRSCLVEHRELFIQSLDRYLPDYPKQNVATLRQQQDNLARQLGMLRPYIDSFDFPSIMSMAGVQWDVYDSAISNDVAIRKGESIDGVLQQLQKMLGRLESMDSESQFEPANKQRGMPQNVTIHKHGAQSRVNLNSTDHSHNVLTTMEQSVFSQVRAALENAVTDEAVLKEILAKLDDFEGVAHRPGALEKFQAFVNNTASYMTLIAPFFPALLKMVGGN